MFKTKFIFRPAVLGEVRTSVCARINLLYFVHVGSLLSLVWVASHCLGCRYLAKLLREPCAQILRVEFDPCNGMVREPTVQGSLYRVSVSSFKGSLCGDPSLIPLDFSGSKDMAPAADPHRSKGSLSKIIFKVAQVHWPNAWT